jgi:predicted nuclease of predicted toxin-antitoxin system
VDVLTAVEAGLRTQPDAAYVTFGLRTGRVIVTDDADFLRQAARAEAHYGIAYYPQGERSVKELIDALMLLHGVFEPDELVGQVHYL